MSRDRWVQLRTIWAVAVVAMACTWFVLVVALPDVRWYLVDGLLGFAIGYLFSLSGSALEEAPGGTE